MCQTTSEKIQDHTIILQITIIITLFFPARNKHREDFKGTSVLI